MKIKQSDKFFSSKLKVDRATRHIRELNREIVGYIKSKPYRVVVEQDPNSPNQLWTLRVRKAVPLQIPAILGDKKGTDLFLTLFPSGLHSAGRTAGDGARQPEGAVRRSPAGRGILTAETGGRPEIRAKWCEKGTDLQVLRVFFCNRSQGSDRQ